MTVGWGLIFATFLLVTGGAFLYLDGWVGCAQLLWVFASGTAGAGVMALIDKHRAPKRDTEFWKYHSFWDQ